MHLVEGGLEAPRVVAVGDGAAVAGQMTEWRLSGAKNFGTNDRMGREAAIDEAAAKVASERRLHILSDVREFGLRGLIDVPRWAVADACRPGQSTKQLDDVLRYGSISRNLKVA